MGTSVFCLCVLLFTFIPRTLQLSTPEDDSYVAAVIEYAPEYNMSAAPLDIIRQNWQKYAKIIKSVAKQHADIVVFPECGLTSLHLPANRTHIRPWLTRIPDPVAKEIPCDSRASNVPEIMRNASCTARQHQIYLVINLPEEAPCSPEDPTCPEDGIFIYNSNAVFDRNGAVIARYRKFNLFIEPGFDITPTPELSTFDTDFGVRFGVFICFDILYPTPAVKLARELAITDFVYPTAWFSELPFYAGVEIQAGWAHGLDVNLLASGYSNPLNSNGGSGIYSGKLGPLAVTMPLDASTGALIHRVPKKAARTPIPANPSNNRPTGTSVGQFSRPLSLSGDPVSYIGTFKFFQDDFKQYNTILLDTSVHSEDGNTTRQKSVDLCHGDFCCHFDVTTDINPESRGQLRAEDSSGYYYRLGVFDGNREYAGGRSSGIQVCGIIPCTEKENISSCGRAKDEGSPPINVVFKSIRIKGDKFQSTSSLQMPVTFTEVVLPLPSSAYEFTVKEGQENTNEVEIYTKEQVNALIGFALYSRVFDRDAKMEPVAAATYGASML